MQQPKKQERSSSPTLVASVLVDILLAAISSGRWQVLPDGKIVPLDERAARTIQSSRLSTKEENYATSQESQYNS